MATYKEQLEVAKSYRLREGGFHRGNCPFCSGRNTYGVRMDNGVLLWGCFRASCDTRGIQGGELSTAGILSRLGETPVSEAPTGIPIPSFMTSVDTQEAAMAFLEAYHCLDAYRAGLIRIRYSPQEDRVMFPIKDDTGEVVGYTGRGRKDVRPKWKKYGDCAPLLTCGTGKTAIVVEDALSACAVGIIPEYTGCALLGTILSPDHIVQLRSYEKVIVALDPDAVSKGLQMTGRIGGGATMRFIDDDLKYFTPDKIKEMLE